MRLFSFLLMQGVLAGAVFAQSPKLYVFLPSNIRPYAIQRELSKNLADVQITVFGRFRAFDQQVRDNPPDAILSFRPVAERYGDFERVLVGLRKGLPSEPYVLISENQKINLAEMEGLSIGTVDLLGRHSMIEYVSSRLQGARPKVKVVSKLEDLLSLLQFQEVRAILVPESKVQYHLSRTKLPLRITRLQGARLGLPVLIFRKNDKPVHRALKNAVFNLPEATLMKLGVDLWSNP